MIVDFINLAPILNYRESLIAPVEASQKSILIFNSIFRSFNLEFSSIYCQIKTPVKLQNCRNCHETIVSFGLGGKMTT